MSATYTSMGWAAPGVSKGARTVIEEIEAGGDYFVEVDDALVDVIVADQDGNKYLRTDPDRTTANNLLSLPACP